MGRPLLNEKGVDQTNDKAHQHAHRNGHDQRKFSGMGKVRGDDAGQRHDRADGEVDASREQHKHHADGNDTVHGHLANHVQQIPRGEERRGGDAQDQDHRQQHQKDAELFEILGDLRLSDSASFTGIVLHRGHLKQPPSWAWHSA